MIIRARFFKVLKANYTNLNLVPTVKLLLLVSLERKLIYWTQHSSCFHFHFCLVNNEVEIWVLIQKKNHCYSDLFEETKTENQEQHTTTYISANETAWLHQKYNLGWKKRKKKGENWTKIVFSSQTCLSLKIKGKKQNTVWSRWGEIAATLWAGGVKNIQITRSNFACMTTEMSSHTDV